MRGFMRASGFIGLAALTVFTGCGSDQPDSSIFRTGPVLAPPVSVGL
ncbi:MAG: hypothetical protein QOI66_2604, partial [Myxococcales bacterium]|nr:hypothetical protein [Myxococcales bacterium]